MKWRTYPDDVLPLFVAEMDFPLAEPIAHALHAAIDRSDTGYVAPTNALGDAFSTFAGGAVVEVPLRERGTVWALDLEGVERAFAAGARAYLLCHPHNPLGHPQSVEDLTAVAALAARYGVTVISDEVHGLLTHSDGAFTPFLSVSPEAAEHGVCVTSASKAWNLAGLNFGCSPINEAALPAVVGGFDDDLHIVRV